MTGPTIAGCQYEKQQQQLQLSFNATLLGETGGILDRFASPRMKSTLIICVVLRCVCALLSCLSYLDWMNRALVVTIMQAVRA